MKRRCRRRPACCSIPISRASKIAWALARMAAAARGGRRSVRRHGRKLAGLPADRRSARHRRDQRLAHRADGYPRRRLGRGPARPVRRAARRRCPRSSIAPGRFGETCPVRRADPDHRHGRRPAGGDDRPGLPRARRHQGDLRHRRLRADQYRRGGAALAPSPADDDRLAARRASAAMRSKARCSSPAA